MVGATVHVVPVDDCVNHKYAYCQCKPTFEHELAGTVVIHKAFDQRPTGEGVKLEMN